MLAAAGTKWNFHASRPGLVGGHCIGVDPYYLTHKAQSIGFHPEMILAGRRINDGMASFVARDIIDNPGDVAVITVGRKGRDAMRRARVPMEAHFEGFGDRPTFAVVKRGPRGRGADVERDDH